MGDKQGEEIVGDKNIIVETVEVQVCGGCYDAVGIAGRKLPGAKWNSYNGSRAEQKSYSRWHLASLPPEYPDETRELERISCPHIGGGGFLGVAVWAYGVWRVAS
jgi:hypothetical protein